jgi:hypothetical protein
MFWFKSCPKCHGDLHRDSDTYGTYIACMQCSHYLTQADETRLELFSSRVDTWAVSLQQVEKIAA